MTHETFARTGLSAIAGTQGVASLLIDLNKTHAANPAWTGHARFHVVWQVFTDALCAGLTVALIWWQCAYMAERFYLAALLTAFPLLGFLGALATRGLYGGTLHDKNGIPPVCMHVHRKLFQFDLNTVIVVFALVLLIMLVIVFRW